MPRTAALITALLTCAVLPIGALAAVGAPGRHLAVIDKIPGPDGSWDYASFDAAHRRVYVAHGKSVMSIDADSGKVNTAFLPGDGLHEVLPIPGSDLLLTTNSGDNTVRIYTVDGAPRAQLKVEADADGAAYDPATRLAIVVHGEAGVLSLVDPRAGKLVGVIKVGGALEFAVVDGRGRLFVNVEDKNEVAVVDLRQRKVLARYPVDCKGPGGLGYVSNDRLITACHNNAAEILDAQTGRKIADLEIGGFPDAVLYDPTRHLAYIPTALDGMLNVVALAGPQNNTVIERVVTQPGARTGAVDPKTGRVYLPTAQYVLPAAPGQRPSTRPGTFEVLVLDRK